jgi:FixJ family two-component response regulator
MSGTQLGTRITLSVCDDLSIFHVSTTGSGRKLQPCDEPCAGCGGPGAAHCVSNIRFQIRMSGSHRAHMLFSNLQAGASFPAQSAARISGETRDSSRIAYLVSGDEQLGHSFRAAMQGCEIRTRWFRSASAYLAYERPEMASCLLISQKLSDMTGLDLQRLLSRALSPPIIFLSDDGDIPSCVRAIKDGAHDFLTLPLMTSYLLKAMDGAFERDQSARALQQHNESLRSRWQSLTPRETEVMRYVVGGFLNKQTAGELRIAENTVQVHRGRVMRQ